MNWESGVRWRDLIPSLATPAIALLASSAWPLVGRMFHRCFFKICFRAHGYPDVLKTFVRRTGSSQIFARSLQAAATAS
jgi:hypothetical protein